MPTLADVASRALVSKTTASRVLNGFASRFRIADATAAAVHLAARELEFRPSYAARALTSGRTGTIGVIMGPGGLIDPRSQAFMASLLGGIHQAARTLGRHAVLTDHFEEFGQDGTDGRFDALIALGYIMRPQLTRIDLERLPIPLILVGEPASPTQRTVVALDPEPGLSAAVAHLAELGHRSIAWVSWARPPQEQPSRENPQDGQWRARCVSRCAAAQGLTCAVISAGIQDAMKGWSRDRIVTELASAIAPALSGLGKVTAVCCYNDLVALAVVRAATAMGRSVPGDLSVIGFDNLYADLAQPALTSVDHQLSELGRVAVAQAVAQIEDPVAVTRGIALRETVPATLVVRASTAAPTQV